MTALSDREELVLELERGWWQHRGQKVQAIRDRLGLTEAGYYVELNALLDREEAMASDPLLVKRLRRRREHRSRSRRHLAGR